MFGMLRRVRSLRDVRCAGDIAVYALKTLSAALFVAVLMHGRTPSIAGLSGLCIALAIVLFGSEARAEIRRRWARRARR